MPIIEKVRQDTAKEKRVELHLHTTVFEELAPANEVVKQAEFWGHAAIAITDHATVAALHEACTAAEHTKVICGMEAYCTDDTHNSHHRPSHLIILAKNQQGLQALCQLAADANTKYFKRFPLTPKSEVDRCRDGLLLGSACAAGELYQAILAHGNWEELKRIAAWYDFLEIQPLCNNFFMLSPDERTSRPMVESVEELKAFNRTVLALGKELEKPVCATGDVQFLDPEDEPRLHAVQKAYGYSNWDQPLPLYFKTTEEMLAEFSYLGAEDCRKVVISDPNLVASWCEKIDRATRIGFDLLCL